MSRWLVALAVAVVLGFLCGRVGAQSRSNWEAKMCATNACIEAQLESLSPERASEAKITTWHNYTYVWYRP